MTVKVNAVSARRAREALGANIKTARLKRRISMRDFAQRISVSGSTVARLEKGDDGVSIGTLAMACLVLGEVVSGTPRRNPRDPRAHAVILSAWSGVLLDVRTI